MTKTSAIEKGVQESLAPWLGRRSLAAWFEDFDRDGYVIFKSVLGPDETARLTAALEPHFDRLGRNDFEGFRSNRVYGLIAKAPEIFGPLVIHPLALAFAERDLGRSCLLSALLAINLLPGESVQGWHYDDAQIQVPRPRASFGVSTFWSLTDTTEENGATELIPGSHLWAEHSFERTGIENIMDKAQSLSGVDPAPHAGAIKAVMPAGSLMIAKGTLWHRGGANHSASNRLIVTPQYCPGWARQLENMMAVVPREVARTLPRRTRELLGYSIHGVFMGYCDGVHPDRLLGIED